MFRHFMVLIGLASLSSPSSAAPSTSPATQPIRPALRVPHADTVPAVTAAADDPAWAGTPQIDRLTFPVDAKIPEAPLPTTIALRWDADCLYVRFVSTGAEPYSPFGEQRDATHYQGSAVEVFLDPVGDGWQYFELQLSPANGLFDQNTLITADPESDARGRLVKRILAKDYWPQVGYDMKGLRTASRVSGQGNDAVWIADFAIPAEAALRRLGKKQFADGMPLRVNLLRYHWTGPKEDAKRRLLPMNWSPVVFGCPHQSPSAMGRVTLVKK